MVIFEGMIARLCALNQIVQRQAQRL